MSPTWDVLCHKNFSKVAKDARACSRPRLSVELVSHNRQIRQPFTGQHDSPRGFDVRLLLFLPPCFTFSLIVRCKCIYFALVFFFEPGLGDSNPVKLTRDAVPENRKSRSVRARARAALHHIKLLARGRASQRLTHDVPIFRLLLKVAVKEAR